jgi:hypothetical protein
MFLRKFNDTSVRRTTIVIGALLSTLIWTIFIIELEVLKKANNQTCLAHFEFSKRTAKVARMNDYTALYVFEGANVILMDKRPKYNALHLNAEQLVTLTNFTHKCILCDHFEACPFKKSYIRLPTNSSSTLLAVPHLDHCKVPTQCFLFGQQFNCHDLVSLTNFTT